DDIFARDAKVGKRLFRAEQSLAQLTRKSDDSFVLMPLPKGEGLGGGISGGKFLDGVMDAIAIKDVWKSYDGGASFAVGGITLEIATGEFVVLVGASGGGKTTLLKFINRLLEPTRGAIMIDGEDAAALDPVQLRRRIGYVFQGVGLFPHMTVAENIAVTLRLLA